MSVTFDEARAAVQADTAVRAFFGDGFTVADYGWHNDDVYLMAVDAADGVALFDAPAILVNKATGTVTPQAGLLGRPPAEDLAPFGDPPED